MSLVSPVPEVIVKNIDDQLCEPYEQLTVDMEDSYQGGAMEMLGSRGGRLAGYGTRR